MILWVPEMVKAVCCLISFSSNSLKSHDPRSDAKQMSVWHALFQQMLVCIVVWILIFRFVWITFYTFRILADLLGNMIAANRQTFTFHIHWKHDPEGLSIKHVAKVTSIWEWNCRRVQFGIIFFKLPTKHHKCLNEDAWISIWVV